MFSSILGNDIRLNPKVKSANNIITINVIDRNFNRYFFILQNYFFNYFTN